MYLLIALKQEVQKTYLCASCYVCFPDRMGQVTAMHFEGVCLIKFPVSRPHAFLHFPQGLVNKSYNIQPNFHFLKIPLSCPRHHLT